MGTVTGYGFDNLGSIPGREEEISQYFPAFRSALEPTKHPIQWILRDLSQGLGVRGVKLTTHLLLLPR
jgi:hypothetical protein